MSITGCALEVGSAKNVFVAALLQTRELSPSSHRQQQEISTWDDFLAQSGNFMPVPFPTKAPICPGSSPKTSLWSTDPLLQQVDVTVFLQTAKQEKIQQNLPLFKQLLMTFPLSQLHLTEGCLKKCLT